MATEFGQPVVTFVGSPGGYPVKDEPADVLAAIKSALLSGRPVKITCNAATLEIVDAVIA